MDYFLEAVFKESSPVSINCVLYFLRDEKNLYQASNLAPTK